MTLTEKIAQAGILAGYLPDSYVDLVDELRDRNLDILIGDSDFERHLFRRARRCGNCGLWSAAREGGDEEEIFARCDGCRRRLTPPTAHP